SVPPPPAAAPPVVRLETRTQRVVVVADDGGAPIEGARVVGGPEDAGADEARAAASVEGTTGADGAVVLELPRFCAAAVRATKPGFVPAERRIHGDSALEIRVALVAGVAVRGRVVLA